MSRSKSSCPCPPHESQCKNTAAAFSQFRRVRTQRFRTRFFANRNARKPADYGQTAHAGKFAPRFSRFSAQTRTAQEWTRTASVWPCASNAKKKLYKYIRRVSFIIELVWCYRRRAKCPISQFERCTNAVFLLTSAAEAFLAVSR